MKRKRARPGQRYGAYVYLALKNQPSYIALENGKVLALENQSDCLVIEVPCSCPGRQRPLQADGGVRSERGPRSGARGAAGPYGGRAARKFRAFEKAISHFLEKSEGACLAQRASKTAIFANFCI